MYRMGLGEDTHHGQRRASDSSPDGLVLANQQDINQWKMNNGALFSVIYLTTVGAAGSILTKFEAKREGKKRKRA
eukprot:g16654.t1